MSVTKEDVRYIASLAKLKFNDKEILDFTIQLNQILQYMDKLNELETENIEPLSHPVEIVNVFREDVLQKSISTESALKNAPDRTDQYFKVPKVISVD